VSGSPLLSRTPRSWAERAAASLPLFLSDHAICEQQAAASALSLVGLYPDDEELVERMTALAAEEISHLRRVLAILHRRGWRMARRRPNGYVRALRARIDVSSEPELRTDRLLVTAIIEARSCERFGRLLEAVEDSEVRDLLLDLGPAEARHWRMFHELAARGVETEAFARRWRRWLEIECDLAAERGLAPTVHG